MNLPSSICWLKGDTIAAHFLCHTISHAFQPTEVHSCSLPSDDACPSNKSLKILSHLLFKYFLLPIWDTLGMLAQESTAVKALMQKQPCCNQTDPQQMEGLYSGGRTQVQWMGSLKSNVQLCTLLRMSFEVTPGRVAYKPIRGSTTSPRGTRGGVQGLRYHTWWGVKKSSRRPLKSTSDFQQKLEVSFGGL